MANMKLTELSPIVTIANADRMMIHDESAPSGEKSKYVTIAQLDARYAVFDPTATPIGEMYQNDNAVVTSIAATDTYYQIVNFLEGVTNLTTYLASALTVNATGDYLLTCSIDATGGSVSARDFEFVARINGVAVPKTKRVRSLSSANSGAMSLTGILELSEDDVVDIAVKNLDTTDDVTIINCNFAIHGI